MRVRGLVGRLLTADMLFMLPMFLFEDWWEAESSNHPTRVWSDFLALRR